ncbi:MAG TPA: IPT/TIG domain-containing protein [Pyrinomonadaceae bacterium]|jgi:hypothetical protein
MAVITGSTFNPLKARCNVRLQQGVPIVDADWNELDDIRKFEMRAYLKWFVGDGIPDGSDAFKIEALTGPAVPDNFKIDAGAAAPPPGASDFDKGLRFAGRAIVDGLDVMIPGDINYKSQPLFAAAAFGVPKIAPMPNAAGPMAVYLDVWERLVTSQEDASLVLPGIGTESCVRMKREWCVRTRGGSTAPQPADAAEFIAGHSYYLLAVINRSAPGANIAAADVQDRRHLRLSLASMENRLALLEQLLLVPRFDATPNQFNPKLGFAGNQISLFGSNLNVGTVAVRFGATPATIVGAQTASQLTVKVPNMPAGQVKITIQTAGGTVTSVDNFAVVPTPAPAMAASPNQFNPKFGPPGTNINVFGSNFNIGPLTARFGVTDAEVLGTAADHISVKVPAVAPGAVKITIQTPGGTVTSVDNFTVTPPPPPIMAFSPNQFNPKSGPPGTEVAIQGTNLNNPPVSVRFGATNAEIVGVPAFTTVIAKVPAMPAGAVKIQVQTSGGTATSVDNFNVTS